MKDANLTSLADSPWQSCVLSVTSTLLYTLNHSGWWFIDSAFSATRDMKPHALLKSANLNSFLMASLPSTIAQPPANREPRPSARSDSFNLILLGEDACSTHNMNMIMTVLALPTGIWHHYKYIYYQFRPSQLTHHSAFIAG